MKTQRKLLTDNGDMAGVNNAAGKSAMFLADNRPEKALQKKAKSKGGNSEPVQKKSNNTGLPDNLKSGIENLSGHSMDDVKVHYNSDKPAQLNAHAYAQGTDIHVASGQEKHLAHEAWHVVQQKQGRVKPTVQMKGKVNVNDDKGLEKEADVMGAKALQMKGINPGIEKRQSTFYAFPHDPVQFTLMGGLVGAAVGIGGALATIGTGGAALAVGAGMGLLGHYMTNQSEVNTPWKKNKSGIRDVTVNLYYSPSLLGHFTILMTENNKTTRIHFVLKEEGDGSAKRKLKQVSGYAKGQANVDENIDEDTRSKYGGNERPVVSGWKIDGLHALKMMNFLKSVNKTQTSYGYIVYSKNVDNCGSMVLKALAQAGISVTLPRWKQWHQLPRFIKDDIKK